MTLLIIGLALFLLTHGIRIYADGFRSAMIGRLGSLGWKGVYSVASLAGLILIGSGYALARQSPIELWRSAAWISHPVALLMVASFVLVIAAYIPRNHLRVKIGHPMVVGVKVWAFAHLLANGNLADVLLFGTILIWAVLSFRAARMRDRAAPKVAVQPSLAMTGLTVALGIAAWIWFVFHGHAWLIGVRPLVMG